MATALAAKAASKKKPLKAKSAPTPTQQLPPGASPPPSPTHWRAYGAWWDKDFSILDVELWCFRENPKSGLGKAGHFWNIVALLWGPENPVGNTTKHFVRHPWADEMIEAVCNHRYVGVGGAANSGKSEVYALWAIVSFLCDPLNTLVIISSTSLTGARKRIWGAVVDYIRAVPAPGLPFKIVDSQGLVRFIAQGVAASDKCGITLVACERRQEKEAVGKLMGMHNKMVMMIADELSELTESILEFALPGGNLTSNPQYQFVGLSNPGSYYDPFAKLWKPKAGWTSVTVEDDRWETDYGIALHLDGMRSPNVLAGETIYPFLTTIEKIEEARMVEGGENSLRFWRMVRGFPCPAGSEETVYSEADIIKFKADSPVVWGAGPQPTRVAALDPAFTNGGDRSIAYFGRVGTDVSGMKVLCFDEYVELLEDVTNKIEPRNFQVARKFAELCKERGIEPRNAALDATGAGNPFADIVQQVWSSEVLRIQFSGSASEHPMSLNDPTPANKRCANRVTELWYVGKELMRAGQIKGISPALAREMTARKYKTTKGAEIRVIVESKQDMKLRTSNSPDIADAAFILVALCRQRHGFAAKPTASRGKSANTWRSKIRKFGMVRAALSTNLLDV